jgi:hypothetical protein
MPADDAYVTALIEGARRWYDAGCSVVPTHPDGSKRPFGAWKQYQDKRMEWDELEALLRTGKYPGIGIITGRGSGNLELFEIEGPDQVARDAILRLQDQAKQLGHHRFLDKFFPGCTSRSPRLGFHLLFRTEEPPPGNYRLAVSEDGKVLAETRGEGGFVVVAPTTGRTGHPEGTAYTFLARNGPELIPTLTNDERLFLDYLFTTTLNEQWPEPPTTKPAEPKKTPPAPTGEVTSWDDYAAKNTWADILAAHGWQYVFTAPDGRTHWTRPGKNISEGTSATTLEDGPLYVFSTSTVFPAEIGLSKQAAYAYLHHGGDFKAAARALKHAGYGSSSSPEFPPLQAFTRDYNTNATPNIDPDQEDTDDPLAAIREKFPILDWHKLWADTEEEEWICEPLIPARRLTAIYSAPKVGKSLLMLEIAVRVSRGESVFGYPAKPPRPVLIADFENDPRGDIRTRLQAMGYAPGDLTNVKIMSFPSLAALDTAEGGRELIEASIAYGCEIVIIDTISRAVKGDENENDTWLNFYRHTGLLAKQAQIAIVRLDHAGKDLSKGQRGGSAKGGDIDALWFMKSITDTLISLECESARFPITERHLTLRRETDPLRHVATNDTYKDKVSELMDAMERHGVPKIADLTVRQMRQAIKSTGLRFDTSLITAQFIANYVTRPSRLTPLQMDPK